jgi:hypothetical protein
MTSSLNNNNPDADPLVPDAPQYQYDLRLEIGVKEAHETVEVVTIFYDLVKRMRAVVGEGKPLVVLTATDQIFSEKVTMLCDDFQKAFKVDKTVGKHQKVLLGFKIRTTTKLYDIKQRLFADYLNAHDLYIREHVGGFADGVKVFSYGFLKDDHPDHPDIPALTTRFSRWIADAWKKLTKDDKQKWKEEMPSVFFGPTGIAIPINFSKERISATCDGKEKITTTALMVTTPSKYGPLLRELLNSAVLSKRINNLIPLAFSREDSDGYYNIVANHDRFMEVHRNIPIMHAPLEAGTTRGNKGATLSELLYTNKDVLCVSHDLTNDKIHVSTTAAKYKTLHQWIVKTLAENQFPYAPYLRPLKYGEPTKFSTVLSAAASVASTTDTTVKTARSFPWKQRPPLNISYVLSPEAFPALPKARQSMTTTPSTASETLDEDTIQSAISAALTKLEAQHQAELASLKKEMQEKMEELESQMKEMSQQVAVQTYQALASESSPLATKTDHATLQFEMNAISKQLSTLIKLFQANSQEDPNSTASPPRTTKRNKPSNTPPEKERDIESDIFTHGTSVSSATSDPDEGMEGCDE